MSVQSWQQLLSRRQLLAVLSVLESCSDSRTGGETFKEKLAESIATQFGIRDVTFFHGPNYREIFSDPKPLLAGATARLLPIYRESWSDKDIFALPQARRRLTADGFVTLDELARLPRPQRSYVVDYLNPNDMHTAAAMHLRLADGEALIGMFDRIRPWEAADLIAIRLLAKHLRSHTATIGAGTPSAPADPLAGLSPRQIEVAELVSDGLSNHEIADVLCLSELSIKKYISRIFEITGHRNRSELATAVLRRSFTGGTHQPRTGV
ncbi:LuxR C-terminal-related transcriptional regulator [Nocardia sp. NPDC052254]|uniref:helix-turn-helix transcriptional regulator n=1 Tax=Nocardia sp. NPDC052254 TaxID=3155681 RepID=UPI003420D522